MQLRALFVVLALVGCDQPASDTPTPRDPEPESKPQELKPEPRPEPAGDPSTCMPSGLEAAVELDRLVLPSGCRVRSGSVSAPTIVRSADQLTAAIACDAGTSLPTVDFAKQQVNVAQFSLSPAYGGSVVVDDGKTVTFVQRDRSPCPDDPLPMPIGSSVAYLLPAGAERNYAQTSCGLAPNCD